MGVFAPETARISVIAMVPHMLSIPLTPNTDHLCIDMQKIFAPEGP